MENLSPTRRGCRFPWEAEPLSFHERLPLIDISDILYQHIFIFFFSSFCTDITPRYSRASCHLECGMKMALETVDCLPWFVAEKEFGDFDR